MSENPFKSWTQADYDAHEAKVAKGRAKPTGNIPPVRQSSPAESKPTVLDARTATPQRKAIYPGRVLVRITSYVCGQLRDSDNVCAKFGLDCCRISGLISDDSPDFIELKVSEKRVLTKNEEGFEVEIIPL